MTKLEKLYNIIGFAENALDHKKYIYSERISGSWFIYLGF